MKLFLDTNIFYGDWHLRSANFKYLFHFINNKGHELLLSRVVLQEVENIQSRDLKSALSDARKHLSAADRLNGRPMLVSEPVYDLAEYSLHKLLQLKTENVTLVDYESVPQSVVVARAIAKQKPFQENEKGYRDTIIWLSLLYHLRAEKYPDNVAFITANKADFFDPKAKPYALHEQLINDASSIDPRQTIRPYASLFDFVNSTIDKNEHAIDHTRAEDNFGSYIEEEGLAYLSSLSTDSLTALQETLCHGSNAFINATAIEASIYEGIEDLRIESTSELANGEVYVSCSYNLRRVEITIEIPTADYLLHRTQIEAPGRFYGRDQVGNAVKLTTTIRPYFRASFLYDTKEDSQKDFTVSDFSLR